jgi:hypothetical protein
MEVTNKKLLWLDDYRNPFNEPDWLVFSPIPRPYEVHWVKSYDEFVKWITKNGLPDGICFDHDLADEHYHPDMYVSKEEYNKHYNTFKEKTGYQAAKWLVDYCIDNNLDLPKFNVQSANPVGKENIFGLLRNYSKFRAENSPRGLGKKT